MVIQAHIRFSHETAVTTAQSPRRVTAASSVRASKAGTHTLRLDCVLSDTFDGVIARTEITPIIMVGIVDDLQISVSDLFGEIQSPLTSRAEDCCRHYKKCHVFSFMGVTSQDSLRGHDRLIQREKERLDNLSSQHQLRFY